MLALESPTTEEVRSLGWKFSIGSYVLGKFHYLNFNYLYLIMKYKY
jgi:hypothetical protein